MLLSLATVAALAVLAILLVWLSGRIQDVSRRVDAVERSVRDEFSRLRQEQAAQSTGLRAEVVASLTAIGGGMGQRLEEIRTTVDSRLAGIQADNEKKLEQMRHTVEEKLQGTLEARLGESFKQVSDRLEQVHKGLGEMQTLAAGVGDLKRVLTNVKTRGIWGEVQLGALLEQMLAPGQYEQNVATSGGIERVEYAIKLPGRDGTAPVWLPIDAKFPLEDYQRLVEAAEQGDTEAVERASQRLESTLKASARSIGEKYLAPPATTDFAILFLSTEGLYAEAMRRPGLADAIQRQYRVTLAGPSTLAALLNTFQMGFRTLAIQRRSSEVWELLGAVKTEFAKYADVLGKVRKKLAEAQNTIDTAETRTRAIQRRLLGAGESESLDLFEEPEDEPPEDTRQAPLAFTSREA